ncbi:MAG: hypothetical protein BGO31_00560 [Bacteroidetes bacterium 43-16]|nr:MAG: hypothetical protein BGO31_00560 [Bacteroidetes bacterium 43-16]
MVEIRPFRGLRPKIELVERVAALPYDVSSQDEVMAKKINPYSFYHITRSEIDVETGAPVNSKEVYEKAKENLERFIQEGIMIQDEQPCYYIYRITMNGRSQTGLVCCSALKDYEEGRIKRHELTRPDRVKDRVDNILMTQAHTGVVFLAYKAIDAIETIITNWTNTHDKIYDFVAEDEVAHSFWVLDDAALIEQLTSLYREKVAATYIADGHHRSHAAENAMRAVNGQATSDEHQYYLTCIFPDTQVYIMDYNRVVKDLNGLSAAELINKLESSFEVSASAVAVKPQASHEFGMYVSGQWYLLKAKAGSFDVSSNIESLDVSILQNNLLSPVLGVGDPRVDERVDFVGGIRGLAYLEHKVDSGQFAVAFSCFPVSMQQLFDVADSGNIMPPKSTWFEPKIRDGLVLHLIS